VQKLAKKTNITISGIDYYRIRKTIGYDKNGQPVRKPFYGESKRDAENKFEEWKKDNYLGIDHINAKTSLTSAMYRWLWDIVKVSGIKSSTFERYEGIYRNYFEDNKFSFSRLEDIQKVTVQNYYNSLFESGKSYSQIKNAHKLLNKFFRYVLSEGYVLKNPCFGINLAVFKDDFEVEGVYDDIEDDLLNEGEIETFSDKELSLIFEKIKNRKLKIIVKLALGTGLRQGEILALNQSDIKNMTVQVTKTLRLIKEYETPTKYEYVLKATAPKSKRSRRRVPIPSNLEKDLTELNKIRNKEKLKLGELYKDNDLLFPSETGTYIECRNLRKSWERALKSAGVPFKKFHSLRHTFATQLLKKGEELLTVSRLLGHTSVKTTEVYAHVVESTKKEAVEKLNSFFVITP